MRIFGHIVELKSLVFDKTMDLHQGLAHFRKTGISKKEVIYRTFMENDGKLVGFTRYFFVKPVRKPYFIGLHRHI